MLKSTILITSVSVVFGIGFLVVVIFGDFLNATPMEEPEIDKRTGIYPTGINSNSVVEWQCEQYGGTWDDKNSECAPMRSYSCEDVGGKYVECAPCAIEGICLDACISGCKLSLEQVEQLVNQDQKQ